MPSSMTYIYRINSDGARQFCVLYPRPNMPEFWDFCARACPKGGLGAFELVYKILCDNIRQYTPLSRSDATRDIFLKYVNDHVTVLYDVFSCNVDARYIVGKLMVVFAIPEIHYATMDYMLATSSVLARNINLHDRRTRLWYHAEAAVPEEGGAGTKSSSST